MTVKKTAGDARRAGKQAKRSERRRGSRRLKTGRTRAQQPCLLSLCVCDDCVYILAHKAGGVHVPCCTDSSVEALRCECLNGLRLHTHAGRQTDRQPRTLLSSLSLVRLTHSLDRSSHANRSSGEGSSSDSLASALCLMQEITSDGRLGGRVSRNYSLKSLLRCLRHEPPLYSTSAAAAAAAATGES